MQSIWTLLSWGPEGWIDDIAYGVHDLEDAIALGLVRAEDFRLAVYLADVEGFAYQEIADIMKTPIGTVMSRLYRGRRMLRDLLADYARERGIEVPAATPSRSKR